MAKANSMQWENVLKGIKFPVSKDALIEQAEQQGIDEQTRESLRQLPNQHYRAAQEVTRALGGGSQDNSQHNQNSSRANTR